MTAMKIKSRMVTISHEVATHLIKEIKIKPEVLDPDDVEMLEDMIMAATNEALRQIEEYSQQSMSKITGGMGGLGGGFPF